MIARMPWRRRGTTFLSPLSPELRRRNHPPCHPCHPSHRRRLHAPTGDNDPRLGDVGRRFSDEFAQLKNRYATPKYPLVLAHGLLGFVELRLAGRVLPPVHYWRGICEALTKLAAARVITTTVPPCGSIEQRARSLAHDIAAQIGPSYRGPVNVISHSMGGLDARHMISRLLGRDGAGHVPGAAPGLRVAALVTVATPHRGSAFADYLLGLGSPPAAVAADIATAPLPSALRLDRLYGLLRRAGLGTDAFAQLTRPYAEQTFNPQTADDPAVRYLSYGAALDHPPSLLSPFRLPYAVLSREEGPNDGLVSVRSAQWGDYRGTLSDVSHIDLINWSNRLRWTVREWMGIKRNFNAVAFYLDVADMLASEGF